jgi:multidrug resistance efflux pump
MILTITLIYVGLIWLIFFKLRLLKFGIPAGVVVVMLGLAGLVALVASLTMFQPYSTRAKVVQLTTPIVPRVTGRVVAVPVQPNKLVQQGTVLFQIDPRPYEYEVKRLEAALAAAEQLVPQLKDAWDAAKAAVARTQPQREMDRINFERTQSLFKDGQCSQFEFDTARTQLASADAAVEEAEYREDQARKAYESQIEGVNTNVAQLREQVNTARLNLEETTIYAPADGYVTQLVVRPGAVTTALPMTSVMNFVYAGEFTVVAPFLSNAARYLRIGDEAELVLDVVPGHVYQAKVKEIVWATAEGAVTPGGTLQSLALALRQGGVAVVFSLAEAAPDMVIPAGTGGAVAVYTDHGQAISIVRKVILRMYAWQRYLPLP